jgi:nitronate monooxygenase
MGGVMSRTWPRTRLTELLGTEVAIVQAPMAGGSTTPELVAAVCGAGGLGSLAAAYLDPDAIRDDIGAVKKLTDRPFNVNLMAHQRIDPLPAVDHALHEQLDAVEEAGVPVFSFTFGIPPLDRLQRLRRAGTRVVGTATSVAEARRLAELPVDAVVAQGSEAGGHRGTFAHDLGAALVGTMALVPQVADAVGGMLPVIAAGGIADGRGAAAAHLLGADGVAIGTAFLVAAESGAHPEVKAVILAADETSTVITDAYTGRHARGVRTPMLAELEAAEIEPFPLQYGRHVAGYRAALAAGDRDRMVVLAGQATRLARAEPAADIVARVVAESVRLLAG